MIKEFSVDGLSFPITVAQLVLELGFATTQVDMQRLVCGEQILLNNTPLNAQLFYFFKEADELRGKTVKVGGKSLVRFV